MRVAQFFHVSDLHFGPSRRAVLARKSISSTFVAHYNGFAGHDGTALAAVSATIRSVLRSDRSWAAAPTAIIASGDLSTWGDDKSIDAALSWLGTMQTRYKLADPFVIYGNHDVWPDAPGSVRGMPISNAQLGPRRSKLRSNQFKVDWPLEYAHRFPLTGRAGGPELRLWSLNTVQHETPANLFALGKVQANRYWEGQTLDQLGELSHRCVASDFNVLVTHHPIHHPPSARFSAVTAVGAAHVLQDAASVGSIVRTVCRQGLVLSGHTHEPYPVAGAFPDHLPMSTPHGVLGTRHPQVVAETASQSAWRASAPVQGFYLLRFETSDDEKTLYVRRTSFRRQGLGKFGTARVGPGSANEETLEVGL